MSGTGAETNAASLLQHWLNQMEQARTAEEADHAASRAVNAAAHCADMPPEMRKNFVVAYRRTRRG